MKIAYKVWLDQDGKAFGEGPYRILKMVKKKKSLNQAAAELGISYRKAWTILHRCEKKLGFPLLERKIGGIAGGGSQVTGKGKIFMNQYGKFRKEMVKGLERIFQKHFGP